MDQKGGIDPLVIDASALVDGAFVQFSEAEIFVPNFLISHFDEERGKGHLVGKIVASNFQKMQEFATTHNRKVSLLNWDTPEKAHSISELDTAVRILARAENIRLATTSRNSFEAAQSFGQPTEFFMAQTHSIPFFDYLTNETMSIHLLAGNVPLAKRGRPGNWQFVECSETVSTDQNLFLFERSIQNNPNFICEDTTAASSIYTQKSVRVICVNESVTARRSITITHATTERSLSDYKLGQKLKAQLAKPNCGILIAGPPGHGKSTFAGAIAREFARLGRITYTIESPRDMVVSQRIVQLSKDSSSSADIRKILLLSRPDCVVFDEMRTPQDMQLYADLRLAGIGLLGVVHANTAVDAIARMQHYIDLGLLPTVFNTVLFIQDGEIKEMLQLSMTVRAPTGITSNDLARPIVEISDLETGVQKYELYSYGDGPVLVPLAPKSNSKVAVQALDIFLQHKFPGTSIHEENGVFSLKAPSDVQIEIERSLELKELSKLLQLDVRIVQTPKKQEELSKVPIEITSDDKHIILQVMAQIPSVMIFVENQFLVQLNIGEKGIVKIRRENPIGATILKALTDKKSVSGVTLAAALR